MKSFQFGQVVLIGFPHTDGTTINKRPALVLSDTNDEDVILCRITCKIWYTSYDIEVIPSASNGLLVSSVIRVHKIAALAKTSIIRSIGQIDANERAQVYKAFHAILAA